LLLKDKKISKLAMAAYQSQMGPSTIDKWHCASSLRKIYKVPER